MLKIIVLFPMKTQVCRLNHQDLTYIVLFDAPIFGHFQGWVTYVISSIVSPYIPGRGLDVR